jgi:hypothetical protein
LSDFCQIFFVNTSGFGGSFAGPQGTEKSRFLKVLCTKYNKLPAHASSLFPDKGRLRKPRLGVQRRRPETAGKTGLKLPLKTSVFQSNTPRQSREITDYIYIRWPYFRIRNKGKFQLQYQF